MKQNNRKKAYLQNDITFGKTFTKKKITGHITTGYN